jgi:1-acyl-sn-glycerol-3-phosphate acyltransferase
MTNLFHYHLPYFIIKNFFLGNINIAVNGLENIPKNQGFIIASNHDHSWDPILIMYGLKKHMHYLSVTSNFTKTLSNKKWIRNLEKLIFGDSIRGFIQRLTQQIPVLYNDKGMNKKAFLNASHYLGKREIIGIFPEGELKLRKKKIFPGVAILARKNNARILPVHVWTNAPSDSFLKPNFTKVKINIGKALKYSKSVDYTKKSVMKEIYNLK